jgi:hypothetical protein
VMICVFEGGMRKEDLRARDRRIYKAISKVVSGCEHSVQVSEQVTKPGSCIWIDLRQRCFPKQAKCFVAFV